MAGSLSACGRLSGRSSSKSREDCTPSSRIFETPSASSVRSAPRRALEMTRTSLRRSQPRPQLQWRWRHTHGCRGICGPTPQRQSCRKPSPDMRRMHDTGWARRTPRIPAYTEALPLPIYSGRRLERPSPGSVSSAPPPASRRRSHMLSHSPGMRAMKGSPSVLGATRQHIRRPRTASSRHHAPRRTPTCCLSLLRELAAGPCMHLPILLTCITLRRSTASGSRPQLTACCRPFPPCRCYSPWALA
mmetsp:Transcript_86167/g.248829  ORF Transcript_86167/g.248829 Transcript_86167/m.248829 type:complete len:246 (-) Transcript_86167:140-877(-)